MAREVRDRSGAIVTFGEAMLRFTPPALQRIEQANAFELWVAGAELNVAVALARLGRPAAWVSRLPDNALGRRLVAHARANGVATDAVQWAADGRVGLLFVEVGHRPRRTASLYDRDGSAFATLDPAAFDWPALLNGAVALHTSGITPALSQACARAAADALAAARAAGCHTSFDLNYRSLLGTPGEARATVEALAPRIDTLIASAGEAEAVFELAGEPAEIAGTLRERLGVERVVISSRLDTGDATQTRRSVSVDGDVVQVDSAAFATVDPLGGGDAFSAGFLAGLLADGPRRGLELGGAIAALKQSIPGDFAIIEAAEVEELAGGSIYAQDAAVSVGGVIPAVVTPFAPGGAVDLGALDAHVTWLHARGIRCIAPLGTNGEGPSLSLRERRAVIERLAAHATGVALLPGTGATSLPETIELSRFAIEHGAAGVLVAPPSFFACERDGLVRYYAGLLDALPADARIYLYHVPAYTGVPIGVADVKVLREAYGSRVAGVKDSGGRVAHSVALLEALPGLVVLSGSDGTVAEAFRAGVHGVVSALANAVPELVESVRAAVAAGRSGDEQQRQLSGLREATKTVPQRAALKALVAEVTGLPRAAVRPPQAELEPDELDALLGNFEALVGRHV